MLRMFNRRQRSRRQRKLDKTDFSVQRNEIASTIRLFTFSPQGVESRECTPHDLDSLTSSPDKFFWIKVNGLGDEKMIRSIGRHFGLHRLIVDDVLDQGVRPKMEVYDKNVFMVMRMLGYLEDAKEVVAEQVSIVVGDNVIVTFQEREKNIWDDMAERAREGLGRVNIFGYAHLLFALLDAVVDQYFDTIGKLAEDIEELEEQTLVDNREETLVALYRLKREVMFLHKSLWPLREVIGRLVRENPRAQDEEVRFFMGNLQQDVLQVLEAVDSLREMLAEMLDVYMSRRDLQLNRIGQLLSIVATIFIPLTFITGYYGMNFGNMPLIHWKYGYATVVAFMVCLGLALFLYFRRKGWFNIDDDE